MSVSFTDQFLCAVLFITMWIEHNIYYLIYYTSNILLFHSPYNIYIYIYIFIIIMTEGNVIFLIQIVKLPLTSLY
jgi:hypothetical protein